MEGQIELRGGPAWGYVPPFRAEERQRLSVVASARSWVGERVMLAAEWAWLRDHEGQLDPVSGPGDLRLGTLLHVVNLGDLAIFAGWEVKLPDARDEGELGTDETDVLLGGGVAWGRGPWSVVAAGGLGILGNPLKFANQDDVPMLRVSGAWQRGAWAVSPSLVVDLDTARNPLRMHAATEARWGAPLYVQVMGTAGLSRADADASVLVGAGWHFGAP